jgi:HAMP domain-containing protein
MTQEEARKLLGGYATNTLSERERTALFGAALEDQDLFNALQNEDALRELLADPVVREQARQALQPAAPERHRSFWMRPWLIGAAGVALAAVVAIGILKWHREPTRQAMVLPNQVSQTQPEAKLEAPQPAPVLPPPAQKRGARLMAPSPSGIVNGLLYSGPLVRYSVLRSGPSGDAVRIEVVSQVAGSLTLYRADAAGQWQRVYPADGGGLSIAPGVSYQIPGDPIAVRGNQKKLRLVIEPAARASVLAQLATGVLNEPQAQAAPKAAAAPAPPGPLVIEIPIGPN